jgi:hypothetical protein
MAVTTYQRSAATVSWIDPATGLPEVDHNKPNDPVKSRAFLTTDVGFRFCNFIEVWVNYDTVRRTITGHGFSSASGIYKAPSYAKIPSQVYSIQRNVKVGTEPITFTQTLGAKTQSPEVLGAGGGLVGGAIAGGIAGSFVGGVGAIPGAIVGGLLGASVGTTGAHAVTGFPPIWSELTVKIFNDGRFQAELGRHSYFPSLTFYKVRLDSSGSQTSDYDRVSIAPGAEYYDAVPNLKHWEENGWGSIRGGTTSGPTDGNPWKLNKWAGPDP